LNNDTIVVFSNFMAILKAVLRLLSFKPISDLLFNNFFTSELSSVSEAIIRAALPCISACFSCLCLWFYSTAISFQKLFSAYLVSQTKARNIHPVTFQSLIMSIKSYYFRMIHFTITLPLRYKTDMSQNNSIPYAICFHLTFDSFVLLLHVHQPVRRRRVLPPKT
jgi:hypothetical protein